MNFNEPGSTSFKMDTTNCKIMLLVFLAALSGSTFAQQEKFTSPPAADAMQNPMNGNAAATEHGRATYTTYCIPCHGEKGRGDGPVAAVLSKRPADHTSASVQVQTDGALFWKIYNGRDPMPGYKKLTQTQIWELVNYVRALSGINK